MHVLLVSHHAPPHVGGVEALVELEARALVDAGHTLTWVTSNTPTNPSPAPIAPGINVIRVPAWHVMERRFGIAFPLFLTPQLSGVLWREVGKADVVHAHGYVFLTSKVAMVWAWLRDRPSLLTDHGGILQYSSRWANFAMRFLSATIGKMNVRLATRAVAYNGRVLELLRKLAREPERVLFLPNPVRSDLFQPPTPDERREARAALGWDERPKVLFVGRLIESKGIRRLLAARHDAFDLVFCGPAEADVAAEVRAAGVEYHPPRPQSELAPLYQAADLFALPSWNEGFPVAIQEALCCGLPVLTCWEEGYAPYRELAGLEFCEPDPLALQGAILARLAAPRPAVTTRPILFPDPREWLERLFGGLETAG